MESESFDVKKSDGATIEIFFNTVLLFHKLSSRMEFIDPMIFSYFNKILLIMHWMNDALLCYTKMMKQLITSSFLLKNHLLPYFLITPSLPKRNR